MLNRIFYQQLQANGNDQSGSIQIIFVYLDEQCIFKANLLQKYITFQKSQFFLLSNHRTIVCQQQITVDT